MDPYGVTFRESCDSSAHPASTGIVFAIDQTGSMGKIPALLARDANLGLPVLMRVLDKGRFIADPQLMLMAFGDATTREPSPLQAAQFEIEAELIDRCLTDIHLVGKGGNNDTESYELAMYFAAQHTRMDCFDKRGRKGYFFMTGDEKPFDYVEPDIVRRLIGDSLSKAIPVEQVVDELSVSFHPFFLIPDMDRRRGCESRWRELLGDHVICMENHEDTAFVTAMIIGFTEGTLTSVDQAGQMLLDLGCTRPQMQRIIRTIRPYLVTLGNVVDMRPVETPQPRRR